jgi:hypothetical protein
MDNQQSDNFRHSLVPNKDEGSLLKPRNQENASDAWSSYSNSVLSDRNLSPDQKRDRTSTMVFTSANVAKVYVGITLISISRSIADVGIYPAIVGFVYVCLMNMYSVWLILKTRNRFKNDNIVDITDLAAKLYGEKYRGYMVFALVGTNFAFLSSYSLFFGE